MSKGQKRSKREAKKPKQAKQKVTVSVATLSTSQAKPDALARGKKKW